MTSNGRESSPSLARKLSFNPGRKTPEKKESPVVVGVGYEVRQVKDIDCVAQRYFCDFTLILKWHNIDLRDRCSSTATIVVPVDEAGVPQYYVANAVNLAKRDEQAYLDFKDPTGVVTYEAMYTGVLSEFMELEYFPLDLQDLSIAVRFKDTKVICKTLTPVDKYQRIRDSIEMVEWIMFEPNVTVDVGKQGRTTWSLQLRIYRQAGYYVWNVILPIASFSFMGFYAFLYDATDWYSRSNHGLQLQLAFVAFKFVIAGSLPKVSYFTVLDLYLFPSFIFLVTIMVDFAAIKFLHERGVVDETNGRRVDLYVAGAIFGFWVLCQVVFLLRFKALDRRQRSGLGSMLLLPSQDPEKSVNILATFLGCGASQDGEQDSPQGDDAIEIGVDGLVS